MTKCTVPGCLANSDGLSYGGLPSCMQSWCGDPATWERVHADCLKRNKNPIGPAMTTPNDAPRPTSELVKRAIDIADRIEHLAYGTMSGTTTTLREAAASLQALEARNKELEVALNGAVDILSGWVTAIQETGTSWDDWDYWYKQAAYNGNLEAWRKLIDSAALHPATKTGET